VGREVRFKVKRARAEAALASARRAGRTWLDTREMRQVLEAYGFPLAPWREVASAAEAIAAAQEIGYPVVLKAASARIVHKTDVGGVKLDLRNADEVGRAHRDLVGRLGKRDRGLRVAVQPMVAGGRELILGMSRDPQFGPLLMFGLGGVFVEVLRDVSVSIHPLTDAAARGMIERVKGYPLLAGLRGEPRVCLDLVEECLLRLSALVSDFDDELEELDLNPLIVTDRRERSAIVDARIALRAREHGSRSRASAGVRKAVEERHDA
jgi:acetyltransferase